jgi:endonuclease/exonuclease/phosphatase (EEP) superfamily protein YafD
MFVPVQAFSRVLRRPTALSAARLAEAARRLPGIVRERRRARAPMPAAGRPLRVLSWNLLRVTGASVAELAGLVEAHAIDVALLQEATAGFEALPAHVGGAMARYPLPGRIHGPAIWARHGLSQARRVPLFSRAIARHAVVAEVGGMLFASVHLSHGQLMCRRQAREASLALAAGPAVIAGDFNMVGPLRLDGFREVGPRAPTHFANGILPLRLDRCFVRGLACAGARALDRGGSDHRPILLDLVAMAPAEPGRDAA